MKVSTSKIVYRKTTFLHIFYRTEIFRNLIKCMECEEKIDQKILELSKRKWKQIDKFKIKFEMCQFEFEIVLGAKQYSRILLQIFGFLLLQHISFYLIWL